jgi:RimJ/RimL family protein N-acetyltransferase
MREALPELFRYAQETLGVRLLRADIDAPNLRSARLFERLGFAHARTTRYERVLVKE